MSLDFSTRLITTLGGLFSQLPRILPELLTLSSETSRKLVNRLEVDFGLFLTYYDFFEQCASKLQSIAKLSNCFIQEFEQVFLGHILGDYLYQCSDIDGSTSTIFYYLQFVLERTENKQVLKSIVEFLVKIRNDLELLPRDVLLSRLLSLSDRVRIQTILILTTILKKHSGSIYLIIPSLVESNLKIDLADQLAWIKEYKALEALDFPNDKSTFESYISDARRNLIPINVNTAMRTSDDDGKIQQIKQDSFLKRVLAMLENAFDQSYFVNIALTGLIHSILVQPNPILFQALVSPMDGQKSLYNSIQQISNQSIELKQSIPSFNLKISMVKSQVMQQDYPDFLMGVTNEEAESLRTIIVVDEFLKECLAYLVVKATA